VLLVQESGGFIEPIREGQSLLEDGQMIAANPDIFPAFAKTIRERE
jgi:myo-inositol-1(or 4)-monophosphatase